MAHNYETIKYTKSQIKKAGKIFISPESKDEEKEHSLIMINNWRASHSFPLQVIYMHVRKTADDSFIVAQRLKRLYSITQKLERYPNMSLTSMQDIGGCRVIVNTINDIYQMVNRLKSSRMRHKLKEEYDYIHDPKPDGYRSYHMVYSYNSDKNARYNGLFIEIQIRTHIQHLWATAVETMDAFTGDPLKIGQGDPINKKFFIYASQLLRIYEEDGYNIDTVKNTDVLKDFTSFESQTGVLRKLKSITEAVGYVQKEAIKDQGYYLLKLNRQENKLDIAYFPKNLLEKATDEYDRLEEEKNMQEDVVLVSTASYNMLKKAYPNYFSDISEFIKLVEIFLN